MAYASANHGERPSAPEIENRRQLTFSDLALLLFYGSTAAIAMVGWLWLLWRLSWIFVTWFASDIA